MTSGTLNDADWNAIKQNEWALRTIDLAGATYQTSSLAYVGNIYASSVPLTTVKLPQGVTGIGDIAFIRCTNLTSVVLPDGLTSIGGGAFSDCFALSTVTCLATMPPGLGGGVFSGYNVLTAIQVPAASVDDYKAAQYWNYYADKIVAIEP